MRTDNALRAALLVVLPTIDAFLAPPPPPPTANARHGSAQHDVSRVSVSTMGFLQHHWHDVLVSSALYAAAASSAGADASGSSASPNSSPFPAMPSRTLVDLAQNQFELLANSISYPAPSLSPPPSPPQQQASSSSASPAAARSVHTTSKIESIALYLPQENCQTGALEFVPTALYPSPSSERMFIASEVGSGLPPTMPKTLAKLPGFAHAQSLLPAYPFASSTSDAASGGSSSAGGDDDSSSTVGAVEEVMCDVSGGTNRGSALSVPLYSGSRTVGVMLIWPSSPGDQEDVVDVDECYDPWTQGDKEQISRAARSIAMALSMDADRAEMRVRSENVRLALEDNLHQVKNPLQAMRTYAKVLQRHIAMEDELGGSIGITSVGDQGRRDVALTTPKLLALAENMMVQSDRVVDLLAPMDTIVDALEEDEERRRLLDAGGSRVPLLGPSAHPPDPPGALVFAQSTTTASATSNTASGNRASGAPLSGSEEGAARQDVNNRGNVKRVANQDVDLPTSATTLEPPSADSSSSRGRTTSSTLVGDLEMEIAFVPDVLEPVVSACKAIAEDRDIGFEVIGMGDDAELPGVSICPKSLEEAVANILDNAIKYVVLGKGGGRGLDVPSNPNPRIRVSLTPNHEPYRAGVTIIVEDNGPGIPRDEREAVFLRGYRGDSTRLMPGSGIGLDISKSMVSRMGGLLDVVDVASCGSSDGESSKMLDGTIVRLVLFRDP